METIFDHKVTKSELGKLLGNPNITLDEMSSYGFSQNRHYVAIHKLYLIRKDKENAKKYLDKIPNTIVKRFTICNHVFAS